jgi:hypothetical protein
MQFDADEAEPRVEVDTAVEQGSWQAVAPSTEPPSAVQIVDGVRRAEAHALADGPAGEPLFGLFGSYAVGTVRCEAGAAARIDEAAIRVERRYLQAGGEALDRRIETGGRMFIFRAELRPEATTANGLVDALNRAMLDAESVLAETLSRNEAALTLVDGPLRALRAPGRHVVGYVKRIVHWYVSPAEQRLLLALLAGERTPLFHLAPRDNDGHPGRYAWYLRIAELGARWHPLGGVMRLEAPGALPLAEAVALADQSAVVLPPLASSPHRDPRAPQNLTPVGALEERLTHRLGDRQWVRRLISATVGDDTRTPSLAGSAR